MFPLIPLVVAFIGSIYAAIWDLRTTEIPDEIPHAMIVFALIFYAIQSVIESNYWIFLNSVIAGTAIFVLGFIMYYAGQWGGGDAKILAAIIFLLPVGFVQSSLPFPLIYLLNVFIVGAGYMIFYSVVLSLMNRRILAAFLLDVRKGQAFRVLLPSIVVACIAVFSIINFLVIKFSPINQPITLDLLKWPVIATLMPVGLFIVWRFAKAVEDVGFKRKIPLSKLKIGDVLIESKIWEGITEKQLKKIKTSGKRFVWVKEGVRFAPTFPLALAFTLVYGDFLLMILKITV